MDMLADSNGRWVCLRGNRQVTFTYDDTAKKISHTVRMLISRKLADLKEFNSSQVDGNGSKFLRMCYSLPRFNASNELSLCRRTCEWLSFNTISKTVQKSRLKSPLMVTAKKTFRMTA